MGVDRGILWITKGRYTTFRIQIRRDGDPFSLSGQTMRVGIQSGKNTAVSSAGYKALGIAVYSSSQGILSATYGGTGMNFTGVAELVTTRRTATSPTAVEEIGSPFPVFVRPAFGDGARRFG